MNDPHRPDPDALLKAARRETRGRLKIFLGAAPGVGKTYEMLRQGAAMLAEGKDVVAGIIETHGRAETVALTRPFEVLPRHAITHGAHSLTEFDIDAMLVRAPRIALIDELAHTNAPGSRHPKRWQDVEELRDAGIDVLSTLNIQHIESLNDLVAGITRVRVRETVPDAILDDAEIEVIDLPPDELIDRLKDGKVYVPEEASRALVHFFSKGNLSALRELALRRAAQAVDRQMLDHVALTGEAGTWAATTRIVVGVSDHPDAARVIRTARRLADATHAPWTAVTVETPRTERQGDAARERLAAALNLAAELGATIANVPATSVEQGLRAQVAQTRATMLVLGKTRRSGWFELLHGSVVDRLVRQLPDVAVHVLPLGQAAPDTVTSRQPVPWRAFAISAGAVALTTLFNIALQPLLGTNALDMIYLVPVIASATWLGLRPALVTSVLAALAYNFFFLPPIHTLTIQDPNNIVVFLVLGGVGIAAAQMAGRLRREANVGARTAAENAAIAAFGQRLGAVADEGGTARATCEEVAALLGVATQVLGPADHGAPPRRIAAFPPDPMMSPVDIAAAEWALSSGEPAGRGTSTLAAADWQFHALKTSLGIMAVLGIYAQHSGQPLPPDRRVLFATLLGQAALAHERLQLEQEARRATVLQQRDDLRATLIAALGHDLRTPLTGVVAAAEALAREYPDAPDAKTLRHQAKRLQRLFADLVEMTRIEGGSLEVRHEAVDLTDAVAAAAHDLRSELAGHRLLLAVPPSLPLVTADPRMLHHVLVNLLDNAAKYAPAGTEIRLEGQRLPAGLSLTIMDEGPGLPPGEEALLFERFARVKGDDRQGGTGLGLAIVKGFADAMGLAVTAANRNDAAGSRFVLTWPETMIRRGGALENME